MSNKALEEAIEHVGGQKPLADRIGTTQSQVWYWLNKSKKGVPAEYATLIEEATGGKVTRDQLRPDIYGDPPDRPQREPAEGASGGRPASGNGSSAASDTSETEAA